MGLLLAVLVTAVLVTAVLVTAVLVTAVLVTAVLVTAVLVTAVLVTAVLVTAVLVTAVLVTAARVDDARAARELFPRLAGQPTSKITRVYADNKYHNHALYGWVDENAAWKLAIIKRPEGQRGWCKLPLRWTV